jgi:peptidoglycan/LPS O-acetylase OafA/YrhL
MGFARGSNGIRAEPKREQRVQQRQIGLDYLRAGAIRCVMIAHTAEHSSVAAAGFIGVELFFVLSGYLVGGILLDSLSASGDVPTWPLLQRFWFRRWMRTLPNYFLFVLLYLIFDHLDSKIRLLQYFTFTQNLAWPGDSFFVVSGRWRLRSGFTCCYRC